MLKSFSDASGKIRIWDTTQKEHLLKYEYTPISGKVKDIAWTEDSKRIAVVGDGREKLVYGLFIQVWEMKMATFDRSEWTSPGLSHNNFYGAQLSFGLLNKFKIIITS